MPLQLNKDKNGCYVRWGDNGTKYHYKCDDETSKKNAKQKAINQAIAIGEFEVLKISYDFDDVLTTSRGMDMIKQDILDGNDIYVISARRSPDSIYTITDKLGIPHSKVFATGSNKQKVEKVLELGIDKHIDNNQMVIDNLNGVGFKFEETYSDYPQQATDNAKIALRWVKENGWGTCGEATGKMRANQLANREPISRDTIARMASFERHRQHSNRQLGDGCGRLMWLAWGGDEGIEWAQRKLKEIDSQKFYQRMSQVLQFVSGNYEFKKWRSNPSSSNVDKIMYNDETLEMVIKFNDGSYYTYFEVDFNLFKDIFQGNGICRTEGQNKWGEWYVGKTPSVGAAVYDKLVLSGVRYTKGGSLK